MWRGCLVPDPVSEEGSGFSHQLYQSRPASFQILVPGPSLVMVSLRMVFETVSRFRTRCVRHVPCWRKAVSSRVVNPVLHSVARGAWPWAISKPALPAIPRSGGSAVGTVPSRSLAVVQWFPAGVAACAVC